MNVAADISITLHCYQVVTLKEELKVQHLSQLHG